MRCEAGRAVVAAYRLAPAAQRDPEEIRTYSESHRGVEGTLDYVDGIEATCNKLGATPRMCRERLEYNPPVRIFPIRKHLSVNVIAGDDIDIIRVLGTGMDVGAQLSSD